MKVLLAHKFLALTGGADVFYRESGRVLLEKGHDVRFLSTGDPDDVKWTDVITQDRADLIKAPPYSDVSAIDKLRALPQVIWSKSAKEAALRIIDTFKPDIMHVFAIHVHLSPSILVAAKERGIPTVMTCNDYKHICPNYKLFHHNQLCFDCKSGNFLNAVKNRCAKNSLGFSAASALEAFVHKWFGVYDKYVDHFTFSADFMAHTTQEFWKDKDISWSKLMNPFDSRAFKMSEENDGYGLYFGRLIDEKGVDILVEAAAKIDGFPIKIVGSGPDEESLKQRVNALGLKNVEFLGALWNDQLNPIIERCRFVVVPSIWHENFPYVINQAFAFGRPVIGANRGGITELVSHTERGLIYDAHDVEALAASIMRLANDPSESYAMGRDAKSWSDSHFNDDAFYASLISAYERAKDAHSRTGR